MGCPAQFIFGYKSYISVEICNQVNSIKYVYNGHDRAQVYMDSNATEEQDEVKSFLDARYVSAAEVRWRIFSFLMHKESSFCQRLDIHLPGDRLIYYNENDHPSAVMRCPIP